MVWAKSVLIFSKIKKFAIENPAALFILAFQALLLLTACLLVQGDSLLANTVATYAYFSLAIGVVIQFFYFVRHERRQNARDDG